MNANELQLMLRERYGKENEAVEWKAASSLKSFVSGKEGEDLLSYVSAFANMDGGCVVMGVEDGTLAIKGIQHFGSYTSEGLPNRLIGNLVNLPSLGLRVEQFVTSDTNATVWVVHVPKHEPRKPVIAHKKAWQRDGDSLVELRIDRHDAILTELLSGEDWSAVVVPTATLDDLDPRAVAMARRKFADRYQTERWASDVEKWTDAQFFGKARITRDGGVTRAALLLLGRPECISLLSPNPAEITWKLTDERAIEHFGPPFLLTTSEVLKRIRNPNIKLFPANQLIPTEMPRYDTKVVLEALHNCIAHQDYARSGRVVVEETVGQLKMTNLGGFVDGAPEDYFGGSRVPNTYRNLWLAAAMNAVAMIDRGGFGIAEMLQTQRKRFLPLPDYEGSTLNTTVLNVYGQTIDENYSRLLMEQTDLPIEQVVWLDRVQKMQPIDEQQAQMLKSRKLIEGRKPRYFVSALVAAATGTQTQYTLNKGLSDEYYKQLIVKHVQKFKSVPTKDIRTLLADKLPELLTAQQKQAKVKNLLSTLRMQGYNGVKLASEGRQWVVELSKKNG
jgi:ATP-dependent DNA helicase RecG